MAIIVIEAEELENMLRKMLPAICRQEIRDTILEYLPTQTKLITRDQAADMLNVSLPTLDRYIKAEKVPAYRIGNSVRLKQQEVLDSIKKIQKYARTKKDEDDLE